MPAPAQARDPAPRWDVSALRRGQRWPLWRGVGGADHARPTQTARASPLHRPGCRVRLLPRQSASVLIVFS